MPILMPTTKKQPISNLRRIAFFLLVLLLASCSKDNDNRYPSVRTDILCAVTDAKNVITHLVLDNGKSYALNGQELKGKKASSSHRCLCMYEVNADSTQATVYQISAVSCYAPLPVDSFKIHPMDPLDVRSVYRTGNFVNLHLSLLTTGSKQHAYDMCLDSITADSTIVHCSFIFQHAKLDDESYHADFYHSIPLVDKVYPAHYDSLIVYINTYDGLKRYGFQR